MSLSTVQPAPPAHAEALWDRSRKALGIARLLVQDRRPDSLVDTACCMAEEWACRLAAGVGGIEPAGEPARVLPLLGAPHLTDDGGAFGPARVALAETRLTWISDWLAQEIPGRPFRI